MMVVDQVEVLVPLHSVLVAVDQVVAVPVVAVTMVVAGCQPVAMVVVVMVHVSMVVVPVAMVVDQVVVSTVALAVLSAAVVALTTVKALAPVSVVVALADCNLAGPLCATGHCHELVLRRPGHQPAAESSQLPWPESSLQPSSAPCRYLHPWPP